MVGFTEFLLIKTIDQKNTIDQINPNFFINITIILIHINPKFCKSFPK